MTTITPARVDEYLGYLAAPDLRGATGQVLDLVDGGLPVEVIVRDLIAPAQIEVGRRWQRNEWSVAQEHAATAVSDAVLAALTARAETIGSEPTGHVVVVCAEDEWHVMPARMTAELLRLAGWRTTFLGGSVPAEHLGRYLPSAGAAAVALSATVPTHLRGAARSIAAAHAAGQRVVAGGAAFGTDPRRAERLGADAWAGTPQRALEVLESWGPEPGEPAPTPHLTGEHDDLATQRSRIVVDAMEELYARFPPMERYAPAQLQRTHEDLQYILEFVEAALLVADDAVFLDFVPWLGEVLGGRGLPPQVLEVTFDTLLSVTDDRRLPDTVRLLTAGRDAAGR